MTFAKFNKVPEKISVEHLHINRSKKEVKGKLGAIKYIDKDTKQHVVYMAALDISGYGETSQKAWKMLKFCVHDFFTHLLSQKISDANKMMTDLGWEKNYFFQKDFSRAYIDINGQLQNLNAQENSVEQIAVVAA